MIKNVICDMGNVLMTWNPRELARVGSSDPAEAAVFEKELFSSPEWSLNDQGLYDEKDLFARVKSRIPENLADRFDWLTENWHYFMKPLPGVCDFLQHLKGKGLRAFMLSNAPKRFPDCIKRYEFYGMLDGVIVSSHVRLAKPDPRIFNLALETFGISADESVFVDDLQINVTGAEAVGIKGYLFDGDYNKLESYLEGLGV